MQNDLRHWRLIPTPFVDTHCTVLNQRRGERNKELQHLYPQRKEEKVPVELLPGDTA